MSRSVFIALLLVSTLFASIATAGEIEAKVQSVDAAERTITLDDGTKVWLGDGVALDAIKEGADVRVSFEEKDGKTMATRVDVK
jgi:Cu/Ag efflux protein CusF